ncbi:MAG: matrixin family metalloprotease [Nitrosopumilus sp.]|uniref:matrixin family metalloprotease n=1 Tax=Nitrosopumilus sp. TaxID=2024843 RepID=UPI00247C5031|nr:matrixin family metalloprotease [Nitrosopumilus sp.]MCV0392562.1 matrixin family metalloprotease [Nitrosopumilus sp.]
MYASKNIDQKELLHQAIFYLAGTSKKDNQNNKTILITIVSLSVIIGSVIIGLSFDFTFDKVYDDSFTSNYVIQNLRGDTIDTWVSWKIPEGNLFHIHVVKSEYATEERLDAILNVIMSTEKIEIDDSLMHKGPSGITSTYYEGWMGALNSINSDTETPIPKKLHFHVTDKGEGDVLIQLTNLSSPDGYSGYTTSIVDETSHEILKSKIMIYDVNKLSIEELKTVIRHELGHGFGLAHSTAIEDLMYPVIETNYPYISECDISALVALYDGSKKSSVVCEK